MPRAAASPRSRSARPCSTADDRARPHRAGRLERGALPRLRRGDRRGALGGAAAPGPRRGHDHHRRRLRGRRRRPCRRPRHRRARPVELHAGRRGGPRLLRRRARGRQGLPALHRLPPARPRGPRGLPAQGDRGLAGALRHRPLRPPAAAQPRPHGLHVRRGLGRDGGAARGRPGRPHRHRARARERLHARPARDPRALRRSPRLGDAHLEPLRALARRARARRVRRARRAGHRQGARLRRGLLRRRAAGP